jgi:hypothetical protein
MTHVFFYVGFVVLLAIVVTVMFRAKQAAVAVFVGAVGTFGMVLPVAREACDTILETGRMEPIAALIGAGVVAVMVGVSLGDALCNVVTQRK